MTQATEFPRRAAPWTQADARETLARGISIAIAAAGLALFACAVLPVVAAAIKASSPGPVFFSQVRLGRGARPFTLYKLRTMAVDAEADGPRWAAVRDPRIFPVGRWLRRSRLDELPQLWNVLKGDMNLVGPRPERPEFAVELADRITGYGHRHAVRPGITGLAQVELPYARSVAAARAKVERDLDYIRRRSPWLDVRILLRTVPVVLGLRGV